MTTILNVVDFFLRLMAWLLSFKSFQLEGEQEGKNMYRIHIHRIQQDVRNSAFKEVLNMTNYIFILL